MAYFEDYIDSNLEVRSNFKGYTGDAPTTKEEYENLDCWIDPSSKPTWDEISKGISTAEMWRKRTDEYPMISDQLDMIYHDLKSGNLDSGTWIQKIDEIKNKYPKS